MAENSNKPAIGSPGFWHRAGYFVLGLCAGLLVWESGFWGRPLDRAIQAELSVALARETASMTPGQQLAAAAALRRALASVGSRL